MNTSFSYANRYQRPLYSQPLTYGNASSFAPTTQYGGGYSYDSYSPSYGNYGNYGNTGNFGIYNRRQLFQAVNGQHRHFGHHHHHHSHSHGVHGFYGHHHHHGHHAAHSPFGSGYQPGLPGIGRPRRANRRRFVNRIFTNAFNKLGKAFPKGANAVERLAGDKGRSTLVDLLGKNDLVGAVQGLEKKGPVTVLAPSNKAFADLAKKQPELFKKLTDPRNKKALQEVLLYHVSSKRTDFKQGGVFDSVLSKDQARFFGNPFQGKLVNGAQRINTGQASVSGNGSVVIPVDQVLIPPGFDPSKLL